MQKEAGSGSDGDEGGGISGISSGGSTGSRSICCKHAYACSGRQPPCASLPCPTPLSSHHPRLAPCPPCTTALLPGLHLHPSGPPLRRGGPRVRHEGGEQQRWVGVHMLSHHDVKHRPLGLESVYSSLAAGRGPYTAEAAHLISTYACLLLPSPAGGGQQHQVPVFLQAKRRRPVCPGN